MKIAVITCYADTNYIRSTTLNSALKEIKGLEILNCANTHKGVLRYPEVLIKLIWVKFRHNPDKYLLTFRGYEILPFVALFSWPKTLIYDEFINPLEWLVENGHKAWAKLIPKFMLKPFYKLLLKRCKLVLSDTQSHADFSADLLGLNKDKFIGLEVGTDEDTFKLSRSQNASSKKTQGKQFKVFYYGSMLRLHGLDVVLSAAVELKNENIEFTFAGGGKNAATLILDAINKGAKINYLDWIDYQNLPNYIQGSDLCLGGPFGKSTQADYVITGKAYQFLSCGAPVLIGQNKASTLFKGRKNCLEVRLGDAKALAKEILWASKHPQELKLIAEKGHKLFSENYSKKVISSKLAKIIS